MVNGRRIPIVVTVHQISVLLMLATAQLGLLEDNRRMVGVDEGSANGIPESLSNSRRQFIVTPFVWLRCTEKLFAYFISVLIEETVQNDGISVVKGRVQPFFVPVNRGIVFLINSDKREVHFIANSSLTLISLR